MDDNGDDDNDDGANSTELEPASPSNTAVFSWNRQCDIVPEAGDDDNISSAEIKDSENIIFYENQSQDVKKTQVVEIVLEPLKDNHEGFQCNGCKKSIVGYRYSCVQCDDYDLCNRCEFGGVHPGHYMLRVPGPRPHEEIQSMLQLIRRQLFQSCILLKSGDANNFTILTEDSIKVEAKDEVEEVDPFGGMARPGSVSPQLSPTDHDHIEDMGQIKLIEKNMESITDLPPDIVPSSKTSKQNVKTFERNPKHIDDAECAVDTPSEIFSSTIMRRRSRQTYMPHKRKRKNSDAKSTSDISPQKVPFKYIVAEKQTFQNKSVDSYKFDAASKIDLRSDVAVQSFPTRFPHKRKFQQFDDCEKQLTKEPSVNVLSNSMLSNEGKKPKNVLSKAPSNLADEKNVVKCNASSNDNVKSDEQTGSVLVTADYLGLSEENLKQLLNVDHSVNKQILIKVNKRKAQLQPLQPVKGTLHQKGLGDS